MQQQEEIEHRRGHYLRQHRQLQHSAGYIAPPPADPIPDWLAPHVDREVTDDPAYRNYALATRGEG